MNSKYFDPDLKINMSLDEIIRATKPDLLTQLRGRSLKGPRRKKNWKRQGNAPTSEHSVPLMSSLGGGYIYVSKKSPLLSSENMIRCIEAASNRIINSDLLQKTKEIVPANYKLVKTSTGVQRVLVPAEEYIVEALKREMMANYTFLNPSNKNSMFQSLPKKTFNNLRKPSTNDQAHKMEVDESDDEIVILDSPNGNHNIPEPLIINIETDSPINSSSFVPQKRVTKTLNDRFTSLTSSSKMF